jgi:7,8-dihydropterin-6-yl-methyl-4-(beta-D-ribofuranosyl)aminobenzene 5'-phosphate synthase
MASVKATVLCENSVYGQRGAIAEHGWSVWLETPAGPYLFDTGAGKTLLNNAAVLSVPLPKAQAILISHHHSDHTSGLFEAVTALWRGSGRDAVAVHAHSDLFKDSYSESRDGRLHHIGVPHTRSILESAGAEFRLETGWQEIAPGLWMTGEVPRRTAYEFGDTNLKHYNDGQLVIDPIRDDQTVVIDTSDGLFVVLGCSHAGLINILTYITEQTGKTHFNTIMGGTHLGPVGEEQVTETIRALHEFDIARIGVSHCTGPKVAARMAAEFGERFFFCSVGTTVEV